MGCTRLPFALLTERDMTGRWILSMVLGTYPKVLLLFVLHQGGAESDEEEEEKRKHVDRSDIYKSVLTLVCKIGDGSDMSSSRVHCKDPRHPKCTWNTIQVGTQLFS